MYQCQICKQFARVTLKEILRHVRDMHRPFTTPVRCGVTDCPATASTYDSLCQHMYKKHRNQLIPEEDYHTMVRRDVARVALGDPPEQEYNCSSNNASFVDNVDTGEENEHCSSHHDDDLASNVLEVARFILKIRDGKGLTQVVTDSIVRDLQTVVERSCESVEEQLISKLNSFNKLSTSEMEEVKEIFLLEKENLNFKELESQYKQEKFFQDKFNYVVCIYVNLWDVIYMTDDITTH